jgi:signal transduction histidine kinase
VEDSGTGIDPSQMDRIFDAFFTTKAHGMGMGLSICRSIIESHGGRLWASGGNPHGSMFSVELQSASPDVGNFAQPSPQEGLSPQALSRV